MNFEILIGPVGGGRPLFKHWLTGRQKYIPALTVNYISSRAGVPWGGATSPLS